MSNYTHYTLLSLSPSSADGYNNGTEYSDVFFNINKYFTDFDKNEICTLKLISAVFPSSCYIIRTGINDSFAIVYSNIKHIITIPAGNYNVYTFSSTIKGLLTDIANFSLQYSNITGKYTMICNEVNDLFSIIPGITYRLFGAANDVTYTSVLGNVVFPFLADFSGISKFRLECIQVPTDNYSSVSGINFLAEIPNRTNAYGITYWDSNDDYEVYIPASQQLTYLNIIIKDQFNRTIDFNKIDWNITLQIKFVNRSIQINQLALDSTEDYLDDGEVDPESLQQNITDSLDVAATNFTDPYAYIEDATANPIENAQDLTGSYDFQPNFVDEEIANKDLISNEDNGDEQANDENENENLFENEDY